MNRLSMNQMTVRSLTVPQFLDACRRHQVPAVGLWRDPVHTNGVSKTAHQVRESGLTVTSLCRGGFLTNPANQPEALADNRRAIDEAAQLEAQSLVLVVGGLFDRDLPAARTRVADAVAELAPYAAERNVVLALEPMHPVFCADRGVLSTLKQALDMVEAIGSPVVRVVVDTVHVWWDPEVEAQIARAGERIALYQVCDWITPLPADVLAGRGIPGQGHIDFGVLGGCVAAAGYSGFAEVEVFHEEVWAADPEDVFARVIKAHRELVLPGLERHLSG
ncbi:MULTISPECIES: sugar phosphate isomerase/epimerase family protein [unclassified Crossiella]|uniref:sugar phosphate isomerase/epimerase family protein n=1 Tax=unclassified Crossiella TaxID=2620835 RepID=UPI001FFEAFA5|nr:MULTISPECIES: sugar phosphate isomerase/epimerase family protein [unclassified Crossiella]MCK2242058.1 sugar phosphate isomerase/epimerase [Crossiella sp. S99.2]MCK2255961.1 sugar phosphate isomerase/epimerase [Crossiella sp. S99.1]